MALFCCRFEHLESEWIFSMYPAGRHVSNSKVNLRLLFDYTCWHPYPVELTTVLQERLSADHGADV